MGENSQSNKDIIFYENDNLLIITKTKLCFHLGGWLGKTLIYTEKIFLLSLIYSNYLKFYFFSFFKFKLFFSSQLQEMFQRIAITLCRVLITQQKISTPLTI